MSGARGALLLRYEYLVTAEGTHSMRLRSKLPSRKCWALSSLFDPFDESRS